MISSVDQASAWNARPTRSTRVQDALEAWETDARFRLCLSPRTVDYACKLIRDLAEKSGKSDLADITTDDALTWLHDQPSVRTAMHRRSTAGCVYRYLVMRGLIRKNPLADITLPRVSPGRGADPITIEEATRIIRIAKGDNEDGRSSGTERARFYLFLWATAFRFSEACDQLWRDVDWRNGIISVTRSKMRRQDFLVLPEWFVPQLESWPRQSERIFLRVPSHVTMRQDFKRAGVSGSGGYHRWRKGTITHLAKAGTPIATLAKYSRHRNISTLVNSYVTVESSELRRAQRLTEISIDGFK